MANEQLDDMVLLRADGTPTYMLSVVVDDHDMGVTHVIRGDDHLTNAFRQYQLYQRLDWDECRPSPIFPLIHGRTAPSSPSATARSASRPIATWATCRRRCATTCCASAGRTATTRSSRPSRRSNGSTWTPSAAARRASISPSWTSLNGHYIRETDDADLVDLIEPRLETAGGQLVDEAGAPRLQRAWTGLKPRARRSRNLLKMLYFTLPDRPLANDGQGGEAA